MTLSSTTNATKGNINFSNSSYSEANNSLGIGTNSPSANLDVNGSFKLGSGGTVLNNIIKTTISVTDNTNFDYNSVRTETVTINGANPGATVIVNPSDPLPTPLGIGYAYVSASNTVKIIINNTGNSTRLGTQSFSITIIK